MSGRAHRTGQEAEQHAADFLRTQGYRVIATNVRFRDGEIDLIADHQGTLVFIEVRARKPGRYGTAVDTLSPQKRARVARAVARYLQKEEIPPTRSIRIDVVAITLDAAGQAIRAELIPDAFGEE